MTLDDHELKIGVFMDFSAILGCDTHFKSGSIYARRWRHLAYVNTLYPVSVAGSVILDLFAVSLQTHTAVARSPLRLQEKLSQEKSFARKEDLEEEKRQ